ncbi:hypothetical protein [Novacetimonas hansenii]|uniref:Uncharacterized protein n=1 Tax=Novacetimonas hansenii TaxID=436 RepID=A0ABQ0SJK3_NOVHA|nr:hypothetical protein [Novacetimonas hansenii]GAN84012.1 hypothetical protein Gaha_0122_012 [Novacetimonas hansenii JCM 7643]GBQ55925.1 hypothetical protein AA0243_1054 [Novacetimonas hansenii NRIC 0243]GEC64592.1 hypothetical protein GHA01_24410 [Novacetimonas hansenii]
MSLKEKLLQAIKLKNYNYEVLKDTIFVNGTVHDASYIPDGDTTFILIREPSTEWYVTYHNNITRLGLWFISMNENIKLHPYEPIFTYQKDDLKIEYFENGNVISCSYDDILPENINDITDEHEFYIKLKD